jgi:hypothetical protein
MSPEEVKKLIDTAPEFCLITGMRKCTSYIIGDNVVYLPNPAYDAYTFPEYDEREEVFYHIKYDMDDDFISEYMYLCELEDLINHVNIAEIKSFYKIK